MKMKSFLCIVVAGSVAFSAAFAQTGPEMIQTTGKVVQISASLITVQKPTEPGWVWEIKRGPGTSTTISPKSPDIGSQATVNSTVPDAQKKEAPSTVPTPTPAGQ
jgi:hypothetical protein